MSLGDRLLSNHIDSIYECVLNEAYWPVALQKLAEDFSVQSVLIALKRKDFSELHHCYSYGMSSSDVESYGSDFITKDILGLALLENEFGFFYRDDQLVDRSHYLSSTLYNHFDSPRGVEHRVSAVLSAPELNDHVVVMQLERGTFEGPFSDEELKALNILSPHFRRALVLGEYLQRHKDVAMGSMDSLSSAVFVVSESGRIEFSNIAAENLLKGAGFISRRDGVLSFRSPSSQQHFRNLLHLPRKDSNEPAGSFCSAWRAMDSVLGDSGYEVVVSRLRSQTLSLLIPSSRDHLVVFVRPLSAMPLDKMPVLEMLYKFTPRESSVVFALCNGETIESMSEQRGVSPHTVRNQVKAAMKKAGVSSQHQLVSVVLRGALSV